MLLVAAATGLFVILGVLVRAVHSEAPDAKKTASTESSSTPSKSGPAPASVTGPLASRTPDAGGRKSIWRAPMFQVERTADSDGATARAPDDNAPPATRGNTKNLEFGGTQLRAQTKAVGLWVQRCAEDAKKKGLTPSGTAVLTYVVAKHGDKFEVEDTGIDEDKTTLQGTELLDCMRTTAFAMHFEGLPREASGIVATRSVTLKDGVITDYKHVGFSYLR
jgi:hypothetical protein